MIYTIGNVSVYDFLEKGTAKLGPRCPNAHDPLFNDYPEGYPGGWAFDTIESAQKMCLKLNTVAETYGVFKLKGDWGADVYFNEQYGGFCINKDLIILERIR